jgi:hypothetical protein
MTLQKYFIYNYMLRQAAAGVRTAYNRLVLENKNTLFHMHNVNLRIGEKI